MERLRMREVVRYSAVLGTGCEPVAFGADASGSIYVVGRRSTEPLTVRTGSGIFPKSRVELDPEYVVGRWRKSGVVRFETSADRTAVSHVQPMGDDMLLVGARCAWHADGPERNAVVVGASGRVVRSFTLGDGIQDVRVCGGRIWVSYFDEGIFGNYGWGGPGPEPIGACGLVGFDESGGVGAEYQPTRDDALIADAYAMNALSDSEVWVCPYTEFPVVRWNEAGYKVWTNAGPRGGHALAIGHENVALVDIRDNRTVVRVLRLGTYDVDAVQEFYIEGDDPLSAVWRGVGASLYAFCEEAVFVVEGWEHVGRRVS